MPPVGLILGHSFLAGLAHSIANANGVDLASLQPQLVASALKIESHFEKVYLVGKRGARAEELRGMFVQFMNNHNFPRIDFVVVDCGSNDIVHGTPVLDVAATILVAVSDLLEEFNIRHVAVCSIIHRQAALGGLSPQEFSDSAYRVNKLLINYAKSNANVSYHLHKGFWSTPVPAWSRDFVHPNSAHGRDRYKRSIKRALLELKRL